MRKAQLEALETEINSELNTMAQANKIPHEPVTDGVIDIDQYLSSCPKMLWILKEAWEPLKEGEAGGGWSLTKKTIPDHIANNQICGHRSYGPMAYVTFSVFNDFASHSVMKATCDAAKVGESLKNIAYINASKFPGKSKSATSKIATYYRNNRAILWKQISGINPDIIIGGSTLTLFLSDFELKKQDFTSFRSLKFCIKDQRLYIDAFHPSQWYGVEWYVDEIVSVIKNHSPVLPPPKS